MRKAASSRDTRRAEGTGLSESRSDAAWKAMTDVDADESDRWNDIEEHLFTERQDPKRWKYFAK